MSLFFKIVSWTSTSFVVEGDQTNHYPPLPSQPIRVQDNVPLFGVYKYYDFIVNTVTYSAPNTTINIKTTGLPSGYLPSVPAPTPPSTSYLGMVSGVYNIKLSNNTTLTTLKPFEVDEPGGSPNSASSLTLFGRGTLNYGETILNNLIKLTENFSRSTAPLSPLEGQLWFNSSTNSLSVYNGSSWIPIIASSTPLNDIYLRLDTINNPLTGNLQLSSGGDASSPSLTFDGDTNTGIYRISENQLGITTGGVLRLTVETTSITSTLPIRGPNGSASAPTYSFSSDTDTGFYNTAGEINWCDEGVYRGTLGNNVTANGDYYSQTGGYFAQDGLVNAPTFSFDNDTDTGMYRSGTDQLSFSTVGTRRLTIESNGTLNVAGTSNYETLVTHDDDIPNKKYVDDATFTHPDPHQLGLGSASAPTYSFSGDTNTGMYSGGANQINFSTGGTSRLRVDTSAIISTLPIQEQNGNAGTPAYSFSSDTSTGMYSAGADQLNFSTGGTSRLTVEPDGTLNVAGTSNYETLVTHDDDIPNRLWVRQNLYRNNILVNGNFNVWQRGVSFTPVSAEITADEWWFGSYDEVNNTTMTGKMHGTRSTVVPNGFSLYSYKITCTTAQPVFNPGETAHIGMGMEGYNVQHLGFGTSGAKPLTISFWVRANHTGTYSVVIRDSAHTHIDVQRHFIRTFTINTSNVWEFKTVTIPGDTGSGSWYKDHRRGMTFHFGLGAGSTLSRPSNVWGSGNATAASGQTNFLSAVNNEIYFSRVKVEEGDVASELEFETYAHVLAKCQRYFCTSYNTGVAPGTPLQADVGHPYFWSPHAFGAGNYAWIAGWVNFPVRMAKRPNVVVYAPQAGTAGKIEDISQGIIAGTDITVEAGETGIGVVIVNTGGMQTVNYPNAGPGHYQFHYTAEAII